LGIFQYCDSYHKDEEKPLKKQGGQGDAPLGLPPPLGERGGHLPSNCKRIAEQWEKEDFNRAQDYPYSTIQEFFAGSQLEINDCPFGTIHSVSIQKNFL